MQADAVVPERLCSIEVNRPQMAVEMYVAVISGTLIVGREEYRERRAHLEAIGEHGHADGIVQADGSQLRMKV